MKTLSLRRETKKRQIYNSRGHLVILKADAHVLLQLSFGKNGRQRVSAAFCLRLPVVRGRVPRALLVRVHLLQVVPSVAVRGDLGERAVLKHHGRAAGERQARPAPRARLQPYLGAAPAAHSLHGDGSLQLPVVQLSGVHVVQLLQARRH